ncbi:hypothetical protein ACTGJ9_023500 [Bradyrhizobium sp. RDM12]
MAIDPRPLTITRPGALRALAMCRDALVLCAALRQHGVPARVRCGFGTYFTGHGYHDHWVCEYWARGEQRWVLVDAELDEPHRRLLKFDFDPTDVPRTAGVEAWQRCRSGAIDPEQLGQGMSTGLFILNWMKPLCCVVMVWRSEVRRSRRGRAITGRSALAIRYPGARP